MYYTSHFSIKVVTKKKDNSITILKVKYNISKSLER